MQCKHESSTLQPQHLISDDDPSLRTHPAPGHALDASSFPRRSAPRRRGADTTRPAPTRHRSHYQTRERNHAPTLIARIHATSAEKQHQQVTPGCVRRRRRPPRAASPAGSARVQPGPVRQPPPPIGAARRVVIGSGGVWSGGRRMLRPGDRQQASSDAFLCLFFFFSFLRVFSSLFIQKKGNGRTGAKGAGRQSGPSGHREDLGRAVRWRRLLLLLVVFTICPPVSSNLYTYLIYQSFTDVFFIIINQRASAAVPS